MASTTPIGVTLRAQISNPNGSLPVSVHETYTNANSTWDGAGYVFDATFQLPELTNISDDSDGQQAYTADDIVPGMWFATSTGKSYKIIEVLNDFGGNDSYSTLRLKDVNLFTLLSDPTQQGSNTPVVGDTGVIFALSEDGLPMISINALNIGDSLSSGKWVTDLMARFEYRNLLKSHYNNSDSPNAAYSTYQVGQMVYLDSNGVFQILDASDAAQVKKRFGVITSVNEPEDGDLGVRPWGKIVGDLDLSSFTIGDALYYDDTAPAPYLTATEPTSSAIPMYIKVSDTTGMYITDMVGEGDQLYISEVDDAVAMVEDHGGLDAGTTSGAIGNGQFTISQILDQILFPGICPTTTDPSADIVVPQGLVLVGTVSNVVLSFSADQGDVISVTGSVSNYAGDVISATVEGSGIPVSTSLTVTPPTTIANYTVSNYEYLYGIQNNWKLSVVFADGPALADNLGESCDGAWTQALLEDTGIVEGVYHVYSGNSTLYNTGTSDTVWDNAIYWDAVPLFSFQNNTYFDLVQDYDETAVDTTGGWTRHRFAIPDVLTLDDVQIYNTSSATYMSVNYANMFTTFNVTLDVLGNTVNYTIYEKVDSPGGGASYRIYFTAQ